jgi:hypothetical protein
MAQPAAPQPPAKVAAVLDYLRKELHKQASELGDECPYSEDQINHITSSAEAFEKAAQEEAQCVWAGIEDALRKEGADEDFIEGVKKEAFIRPMLSALGRGLAKAGPAIGRGLNHGFTGATLGGLVGNVPGAMIGGAIGGLGGSLGYGKASVLGGGALAGGAYLGAKGLGGAFGDSGNDVTGNPASRNRALPFASNKTTGALGGAMLGGLLANEMGMGGHAAWMMPVLGGLAGHHYLPNMMNKWKDPYGYGANAMSEGAANMNKSMPLVD